MLAWADTAEAPVVAHAVAVVAVAVVAVVVVFASGSAEAALVTVMSGFARPGEFVRAILCGVIN